MVKVIVGALAALWSTAAFEQPAAKVGLLLLAHGGKPEWNERVNAVAKTVDVSTPTEVAFGMASRAAIQRAVDQLASRGVTQVIAVPLFASSHSSVITSTEYLLGLRADAPKDLALFAKMDHSSHSAPASEHHIPLRRILPHRS
ncbi:MAG: CbiX/SirB N-terminal domain-containing protein [Vicinamibacterales bacterium]